MAATQCHATECCHTDCPPESDIIKPRFPSNRPPRMFGTNAAGVVVLEPIRYCEICDQQLNPRTAIFYGRLCSRECLFEYERRRADAVRQANAAREADLKQADAERRAERDRQVLAELAHNERAKAMRTQIMTPVAVAPAVEAPMTPSGPMFTRPPQAQIPRLEEGGGRNWTFAGRREPVEAPALGWGGHSVQLAAPELAIANEMVIDLSKPEEKEKS